MRRKTFYAAVFALAAVIAGAAVAVRKFLRDMPSYQSFEEYQPSLTTRVFGAGDDLIAELSIEKRALLTLAQIPVDLQNAVLAIEDNDYFEHWGISPKGLLRAFVADVRAMSFVQGGSTLTQQLSKLIFLSPEKKIVRKIKEMLLAVQMERNLSKEEIFQFYLNQIYFGHGAYGVLAASHIYFAKEVKDLTLAECALLAGMIKKPAGYSPFKRPKRSKSRRDLVLRRMREEGFISREELDGALKEALPVERPATTGLQAPHFVEHVRRRLEPKLGYNTLWRGGLNIYTTIDMDMQRIAEEKLEEALGAFDEKAKAEWEKQLAEDLEAGIEPPTVSTSPPDALQGIFLILDVKSGAIRAMIGGRSGGGRADFNRTVQARRQPGSTFKPFVWGAALETGLTGMTLVEDEPLAYYFDGRDWRLLEGATDQFAINLATAVFAGSSDFKVWVPSNFDDKYLGVITLRKALALSRNVASIRLIQHIGPPRVVEFAHKAGIRSRLSPHPALGLGASVVSPLELANAFATIANGGIHVEPYSVVRVEDANGRVIERHVPNESEGISPQTSYLLTHLMKVVVEGGTGRHARALKRPLAGKTGTSNDGRDLWFVGFTPDILAVAWMGYDNFASLGKHIGSSGTVVPWWTAIMKAVMKEFPPRDFPVPDGIVFHKVDAETGFLALPSCPKQVLQAYREGTEPTKYCPHDHSQAVRLQADFSISGEMESAFTGEEEDFFPPEGGRDEYDLPELPTDDELERLSDTDY